jgi:uncharacterized protein (TIRG00374 family)
MNPLVRRVVLVTLLAIALYGAFVVYSGYARVERSLRSFDAWTFAAALGLSSANYLLRFLKWQYYLARLGIRGIPRVDSLLVFLSGFVLTVTPGKVGEVFKSAVLSQTHGIPAARTAPIVFAERLTDVVGVVVLILLGSLGFSGGLGWALAGAAAVGLGLLSVVWQRPARSILSRLARRERTRAWVPKLEQALDSLRVVAGPAALGVPSFLSILGWGLEAFALSLLLQGFAESVPLSLCVFFYSTATLAGAIIPVPGGLGVVEAMIQEQLVHIGAVAAGPATAAMLLLRFATLWWAVLVGFAALGILRARFPALSPAAIASQGRRPVPNDEPGNID